jgi:hypothetical protein
MARCGRSSLARLNMPDVNRPPPEMPPECRRKGGWMGIADRFGGLLSPTGILEPGRDRHLGASG